jgi:GNAT superfamily N-acetyltransferase
VTYTTRERALTLDDYEAMMDLWRRAGLNSIRPQGRDSPRALAAQIAGGTQHILGLEADNGLVALIVATHDGRKGWLNRLAVDPAHRGQGLARRLIASAERWLKTQGIEVLAVLIEQDNEASLQLFASAGYELSPDILYLSKRPDPTA